MTTGGKPLPPAGFDHSHEKEENNGKNLICLPRQHLSQCFCAVHFSGSGEPAWACRAVCNRFGGDVDGGDRECDLSADAGGAGAEGCAGLLAKTLA